MIIVENSRARRALVPGMLRCPSSQTAAEDGQAHGGLWGTDAILYFSLLDDLTPGTMLALGVDRDSRQGG
jgi:hypothetical protein